MGKHPIQFPTALRENDFEQVSTTRVYPLGLQLPMVDATQGTTVPYATVYEYCQAGEALTQYGVYAIKGASSTIIVGTVTNPLTAAGYYRVTVPQTSVANGSYFWTPVKGICTMAHTAGAGVNMTAGTNFKIANAATVATVQTVSNSTATAPVQIRDVHSIAFASGLSGTSANINVYLYGDPIINSYAAIQ